MRVQHEKAKKILLDNRRKMDELAQFLYERETITGEEFMEILERPVQVVQQAEAVQETPEAETAQVTAEAEAVQENGQTDTDNT